MIKYRVLSLLGFATGAALVLVGSPPTFLQNPDSAGEPINIEPVTQTSPSPKPSISISETPTPTSSAIATAEPTAQPTTTKTTTKPAPTAVTTTKPTATPTASITKSVAPVSSTKTLTGDAYAASKYGSVQVQVVVTDGVVTSAKALVFPSADSRSSSISASSIPVLIQQTLAAKSSSDIQGVTGASYTSAAWIDSLQSALAKL